MIFLLSSIDLFRNKSRKMIAEKLILVYIMISLYDNEASFLNDAHTFPERNKYFFALLLLSSSGESTREIMRHHPYVTSSSVPIRTTYKRAI